VDVLLSISGETYVITLVVGDLKEWSWGVVLGSGLGEWSWGVVLGSGLGEWSWGVVF